ncbi:HPr family phosphocarrier protein [Desulfovibrio mangrovi]|uniref:HPr family phosphocarrier protein n=1 Tax=Desulfovibrio mangrovi TaxID=2976983 RepID=UPI0022484EBB|nr:HPr family phosphocarrier protein [Desulfovibrio mangrovi]UZP67216.1 HPr family phosphocarrier protein [Desulfovibrio mangrovi]
MHNTISEHEGCFSAIICVRNELGLHARPAARIAQEAQKFQCELRLVVDDQEVDAKSILDILSLAAARGTELTLKGWGDDAKQALEHMAHVFQCTLGEGA